MTYLAGGRDSKIMPVADSSQSYWRTQLHPMDEFRSSDELPNECDIAIIGAGMSGVAVAYHLLQGHDEEATPSIVILDARQLCSGATGRNGGHVKFKSSTILDHKKTYGVVAANELATFVQDQIAAIKSVVEKEELDCEFEIRRSYDVFLDAEEGKSMKEAFQHSVQYGERWTRNVGLVPEEQVEEITAVKGAQTAINLPACSLWPYKFVSQLLERIADRVNIQMLTPVNEVKDEHESGKQILYTSRGKLRANKVVFATNAYTAGVLPAFQDRIVPTRAHCSHITRDSDFQAPHLATTYNVKYGPQGTDYINPRPDGGVIAGGAKWTYKDDLKSWYNVWDDSQVDNRPREHFDRLMHNYFVDWDKSGAHLDYLWSGIIGITADGLPYIGHVPGAEGRQYIIAGFNGGGMALIFLSALGLANIIKDDIPFSESGLPALFEVTSNRLERQLL